jgi:preprotein translocase subunit SecD
MVIFAISLLFGIFFSLPSFFQGDGKKISLGLDLQGGLHMLLGVNVDEAVASKIKAITRSVKYYTTSEDILIDELVYDKSKLSFVVLDKDEMPKIDKMLAEIEGLDIKKDINSLSYTVSLTKDDEIQVKQMAVNQVVETIRNRLDQFGLAEPTVIRQGDTDIVVELPGIKSAAEEQRARELIAKPANLELLAVDEQRADQVYSMSDKQAAAYGDIILPFSDDPNRKILLKEIAVINGDQIVDATVAFDQNNQPVVNFKLSSDGAALFADFTGSNINKRMAIVLDGKVYSAPVIRERIGGGSVQVSGGFTVAEAGNVAIALKSGALPASVVMLEKRSVGPSLGADSIRASLLALVSGFVLVMIFMVVYYGYAGIIANIALITNIFLIIAVMAMFGATLTLPGMAGIVLTVGMAVDANVIINERIREFLRAGQSVTKSIENGYNNALRAIIDANVTTLLAAVILYAYGTGPVKGFAITISIGILASMLTAILGTHGIYQAMLPKIERAKNTKRWFGVK